MKRRDFLAAASIAPIAGVSSLTAAEAKDSKQQYFEFRQYHLNVGSKKNMVGDFLREAQQPDAVRAYGA